MNPFNQAWDLLKALPEQQLIQRDAGDPDAYMSMGTIHPQVASMIRRLLRERDMQGPFYEGPLPPQGQVQRMRRPELDEPHGYYPPLVQKGPRIPRKKGQPAKSKKHSDLYTDEDPKGTIHGLGFKDPAKARASVAKIRGSSRSHAHKTQAAIAMEQRAREMGKTSEAAIYRRFIEQQKRKTKERAK